MKQKVSKATKVIISLVMVICLMLTSLIGLTIAYYSDTKSYSGNINFGFIELNVTGDSISGSDLTFTNSRLSSDTSWTGNVMTGDTVTMSFTVGLKSGSDPVYYLVRIFDEKGFFTTTGLYYYDSTNGISTGSSSSVGTLKNTETHTFKIEKTVDENTTGAVITDTIKVNVCAVQQANMTTATAYEYLYDKMPKYTRIGNYIYFGSYPQTYAGTDEKALGIGTTTDENGYYIGTGGTKYAKIEVTPFTDGEYEYSDESGTTVYSEVEAYFKVEPLKWRILKENENGTTLVVCQNVVKAMAYSEDGDYSYENSDLRTYLNKEFKYAFSASERKIIKGGYVDNSESSAGDGSEHLECEDTYDGIFALSYQEANTNYGDYSDGVELFNLAFKNTDYALATGAYNITDSSDYYGCGRWWLRSNHNGQFEWAVQYTESVGMLVTWWFATFDEGSFGVVPAMNIVL